jgi:hypothetical protein
MVALDWYASGSSIDAAPAKPTTTRKLATARKPCRPGERSMKPA